MKRLWLNLSPYNMRLIVVRSAAVTGHKLVVMGSGINQNTAVLESLGFARETGFKNEYWSRPLAGANNALILSKLPAAILEETEIDQIMPTRYGSALARRDVKNSNGGKSNASEPKTQRDAPLERSDADHGLRSHAVAGAGADAPLGADLPSDADGAGPRAADAAFIERGIAEASDEPPRPDGGAGAGADARVEAQAPSEGEPNDAGSSRQEPASEDARQGSDSRGHGEQHPPVRAGDEPESVAPVQVDSEQTQPWMLTSAEWNKKRSEASPSGSQGNFTRASGNEAVSRATLLEWLKFGVNDDARLQLNRAEAGEIKLTRDEVDHLLSQINTPVTHEAVVAKAVREGLSVPANVLAEYPALTQPSSSVPVGGEAVPVTTEQVQEESETAAEKIKWFGSLEKANAFIEKKKLGLTHEVFPAGRARFEIRKIAAIQEAPEEDKPESSPAELTTPRVDFSQVVADAYAVAGGYVAGKERALEVPFEGNVVRFLAKKDSPFGPYKLRTFGRTQLPGVQNGVPAYLFYSIRKGGELILEGERTFAFADSAKLAKKEFDSAFAQAGTANTEPESASTVVPLDHAALEQAVLRSVLSKINPDAPEIALASLSNEALMVEIISLSDDYPDQSEFARAVEHFDFQGVRATAQKIIADPAAEAAPTGSVPDVAPEALVPPESNEQAVADPVIGSSEPVQVAQEKPGGSPRSGWRKADWDQAVREVFEGGDASAAHALWLESPDAQPLTLGQFVGLMHLTAGGDAAALSLTDKQRAYLSSAGLSSEAIAAIAEHGPEAAHEEVQQFARARLRTISHMMVQAGWMQVGFAFAKAGQRISVKAEGAGWEYTLMGLPGGGVVTGRDSFDQDPINFAASYLKSLEQPEVEAPAIIAQAADESDPIEEAFPPRVWSGFTASALASSHGTGFNVSAWEARCVFIACAKAEKEGVSSLAENARHSLLRFGGWGGVANDLRVDNGRSSKNDSGNDVAKQLAMPRGEFNRHLLSNRLESYYTHSLLIQPMWKGIERLGVAYRSRVLDAGSGAGYFFVGAPEGYQTYAKMIGVECDSVAVRLARINAPDARFIEGRLENQVLASDFDLVVGNVPFGETQIRDRNYPNLSLIHDYFIVRGLDQLSDGGIMAVITSSGTMDKKDDSIRQQMMERADLVAAFRLPQEAFEGTGASVTTDILFLQKRPAGTVPSMDYLRTGELVVRRNDQDHSFNINQYFIDNPDNVFGRFTVESSAFGPKLAVRMRADSALGGVYRPMAVISKQLEGRIETLPEGLRDRAGWQYAQTAAKPRNKAQVAEQPDSSFELEEYLGYVGDYTVVDGQIVEIIDLVHTFDDEGVRNGQKYIANPVSFKRERDREITEDYIPVRDAARSLMRAQVQADDEELAAVQAQAREAYEAFVGKHGPLNHPGVTRVVIDDAGVAEALALEVWDDENETLIKIADSLTKRVVLRPASPTPSTPVEAMYVSLDQKGRVDFAFMAACIGQSQQELKAALLGTEVFENPQTGEYEPAFLYLSGNVVDKLNQARVAAVTDDRWLTNVQALEGVQPAHIPFGDITIRLGANWIPEESIREFTAEIFGGRELEVSEFRAMYHHGIGEWTVTVSDSFKSHYGVQRNEMWGSKYLSYEGLLERLLNNSRPTHTMKQPNGKTVVDDEATMESRAKQDEINDQFHTWVASSPERAERFAELYNEACNLFVTPVFDGSRLTFPGLNPAWGVPMGHQATAVAMQLLGYNCMAAHPVGAGKTFEMVAGALKMKQVGMVNKPAIAVPNHMLAQMTRDAKHMFPGASILMISKEDLAGANRKRFLAIARNNDWDLIVCTHSILNGIRPPLEVMVAEYDNEIATIEQSIAICDTKRVERRLLARKKTVESQRDDMISAFEEEDTAKGILTIDQTGIDLLNLDEAHLYKNLELNSSLNVLGVTTGGSARASNLWGLSQYFRSHHGKSFGLNEFTGTPIANSMCELYVHNKYLRPELLEQMGIWHFDEWANRFGSVVTALEALPEGTGFRVNERFAKFVNAPEMLRLFRTFADVRTAEELNLPRPKLTTIVEAVEQTEWQKHFMKHLSIRAMAVRGKGGNGKKVDPSEDNMLAIATAGRKASTSMRLVAEDLPDESARKIETATKNILAEYQQTMEVRGAQLVFMDIGTPSKNRDYSCYQELKDKLIAGGIPAREIAFIHDAKTDDEKAALFARVRSGDCRVLIGSTEKMGVGTNVQERLCALHNIDCPWRPDQIAQRIGRLARRGNKYFTDVREYRYSTVDSFDLFMWETNKRKAQFISQAMANPTSAGREIVEEMDLGFAEVMAVTTGNPKIKEKVELDDQVSKLDRKYKAWLNESLARTSAMRRLSGQVSDLERRLALVKQAIALMGASKARGIEVKGAVHGLQDGSTTWFYATPVGEAIESRFAPAEIATMRNNEEFVPLNIKIGNLEMVVTRARNYATETIVGREPSMVAAVIDGVPLPFLRFSPSKDAKHTGTSMRKWLKLDTLDVEEQLGHKRDQLDYLKSQPGLSDTWPHEGELKDLRERKRALDAWFASQVEEAAPEFDPFEAALAEYRAERGVSQRLDSEVADKDLDPEDDLRFDSERVVQEVAQNDIQRYRKVSAPGL